MKVIEEEEVTAKAAAVRSVKRERSHICVLVVESDVRVDE